MGTEVTVLAPPGAVTEASERVAALFAAWEASLSRFRPESELSQLNASGSGEVSELLLSVLEAAIAAARRTHGVFDPTLLPHLVAAGYDRDFKMLDAGRPAPAAAPSAPATGAWRGIEIDRERRRVRLPAGAGLDLGGIAKGMAVDAASAELDRVGLPYHAVDAGGDLVVKGTPAGLECWPVGVEVGEGEEIVVGLHVGALATSSVLGRRWQIGGEERHHLIDPRTGVPARTSVTSVTAAAPTCETAEVAAKAALILGAEFGAPILASLASAGLLVLDSGRRLRVGPWPEAA